MALSEEDKAALRATNAALNRYANGVLAGITHRRQPSARESRPAATRRRRSRCPECGRAMKKLPGYPERLGRGTREIWICDTAGCPVLNVTVERI